MKKTLTAIEVLTLFACNLLVLYSFSCLSWTPRFSIVTIFLGLAATIVMLVTVNTLGHRRLIYTGALLTLPLILGKSMLQWSLEYHYVKTEFIWTELKHIDVPRMTQHTLEAFNTTEPTLNVLIITILLTTGYISLFSFNLIKTQFNELAKRGGTPESINNLTKNQLKLQARLTTQTVTITIILIVVTDYLNTSIRTKLPGILSIIPALIGVGLIIRTIKETRKEESSSISA
jgi:peptidoglycan/LPS O-acetylase OafA/YrhL